MADLGSKKIGSNYQTLLQISSSGEIADASGSGFGIFIGDRNGSISFQDDGSTYARLDADSSTSNKLKIYLADIQAYNNHIFKLTHANSTSNALNYIKPNDTIQLTDSGSFQKERPISSIISKHANGVFAFDSTSKSGSWTGGYTYILYPRATDAGSGTGLSIKVVLDGSANATVTINTHGYGYANGDTIKFDEPGSDGTSDYITCDIVTAGLSDYMVLNQGLYNSPNIEFAVGTYEIIIK